MLRPKAGPSSFARHTIPWPMRPHSGAHHRTLVRAADREALAHRVTLLRIWDSADGASSPPAVSSGYRRPVSPAREWTEPRVALLRGLGDDFDPPNSSAQQREAFSAVGGSDASLRPAGHLSYAHPAQLCSEKRPFRTSSPTTQAPPCSRTPRLPSQAQHPSPHHLH